VVVGPITPSISTQVLDIIGGGDWTGNETAPATAGDSVTVNGYYNVAPTGTVDISMYQSDDCAPNEIVVSVPGVSLSDAQSSDWGDVADLGPGTYSFQATYSGDTNYNSVTALCEPFTVGNAPPSITSTPNVTTVDLGASTPPVLNDTATLSGGTNPTGTIDFQLVDTTTNTVVVATTPVAVSGDGTYSIPTGYTLPSSGAAGNYQWNVAYSGDTNNAGTSDLNDPAEQVTVYKAVPTISSTPNVTTVNLGASTPPVLTDTVTLAGGYDPAGSITFTLLDTATHTTVDTEAVNNVSGNGSYTTPTGYTLPTGLIPPVPGLYQWEVSYSGDPDNVLTSDVGDPAEQVSVNGANPSLSSTPSATTYTLGTSTGLLKDTVTISNGYNPQGTLTFTLVYNGNTVDTETINNVSGNGNYTTPTGYTVPTTGTVTGTYQWNVQYSGDTNNASAQEANNANEQVVVKGHPETTTTSMNIVKGNVIYGAEAVQTVNGVVTGQKSDGAPVGSVNVTYGTSATPLCSAVLVPGTGDTSTYKCALSSNTQLAAANYLTVRATFVPASVSSTSPNYAYTTSMSGPFSGDNFLVKKDSTTTKVSLSPSSVILGSESSAVFSVSVSTGNGEVVPNAETVSVKVGSASCVVTLSAGKGTCFIGNSVLSAGSYSVSASYAGDINLSNSSGSGPTLTVKKHS
jgi:hypothetical protein